MVTPLSSAISPQSCRSFVQSVVSRIGGQSAPELPTHSGHISQATGKDSEKLRKGIGAAISDEDSSEAHPQIKGKPAPEHKTTEDEIHQRTPPYQSFQPESHHLYNQGFIFSGEQFESPSSDANMLPLVPHTPTQGDRYQRERIPPDVQEGSNVVFKSGPQPIQKINNLPAGWVEDIHPDGQLLYSKVVSSRDLMIRVHTDLALRDPENHPDISVAFGKLSQLLDSSEELHNAELKDSEIEACILELVSDEFADEFGYYLVNHRDQTTFWLQEVNASDLGMWAYDEDVYRHKLAEEYWRHVMDFPHYCCLSSEVWDQLGPLMLVGAVDQEYGDYSTAPKDAETLARLEGLWHQAKEQREPECNRAACNWICARLWYDLVTPRNHNFWGTDYARLERGITVGEDPRPSQERPKYHLFIRFICLFLLWDEPAGAMRLLDDAWPGGIIYQKPWNEMMTMFSNEWEKILLLGTVTFAGAMAFLAIPAQTLQGGSNPQETSLVTSLAITCGIMCCAFSVASLLAAWNLKRDFGGKIAQDVHEAGSFLRSLYSDSLGHLKWGIWISLPRILFQWAVASFFAGLVILAFQLHQTQKGFFYAEISIDIFLAGVLVVGRYLSPDRIQPESILKRTVWNATERATTLVPKWLSRGKATAEDQRSTASPRNNRSQSHVSPTMGKSETLSMARGTVSGPAKRARTLVSNWLSRGKGTARGHSPTDSLRSNRSPRSTRDRQSIRAQRPSGDLNLPRGNELGLQLPCPSYLTQARQSAIE